MWRCVRTRRCAGIFLGILFVFFSGAFAGAASRPSSPFVDVVDKASPAVVNIDTETLVAREAPAFFGDPFFREFFGREFEEYARSVPMKGRGSGFIVNRDGYILTNSHVIDGADAITVTLSDGREFDASVVGTDPTFDLGVVKIEASNLPVLSLGDSEGLRVGEYVLAIGNPYGLEHTVTLGVVSAKNRSIHAGNVHFEGFLQTDAAINPGNSGGPLLDARGEVVGINTAIIPYAQGIGFAVPAKMAGQVLEDILTYGKVNRGWLGVYIQPVTKEIAEAYGFKDVKGALVSDILPGSPAEKAGLRRGDVITKVNRDSVNAFHDLVFLVRNYRAGDSVELQLFRNGEDRVVPVVLDALPGEEAAPEGTPRSMEKELGFFAEPLDKTQAAQRGLKNTRGMHVVQVLPGTKASRVGLRKGDIILEVNGRPVPDSAAWGRALKRVGNALVFLVNRDGRTFFVSLRLE